jgi:hypothetical protein
MSTPWTSVYIPCVGSLSLIWVYADSFLVTSDGSLERDRVGACVDPECRCVKGVNEHVRPVLGDLFVAPLELTRQSL